MKFLELTAVATDKTGVPGAVRKFTLNRDFIKAMEDFPVTKSLEWKGAKTIIQCAVGGETLIVTETRAEIAAMGEPKDG